MCLNVCLDVHQTPQKFMINNQPSIFRPTFSNTDLNLKNKILKTAFFCQPHRHDFLGNLFANLKISFLMSKQPIHTSPEYSLQFQLKLILIQNNQDKYKVTTQLCQGIAMFLKLSNFLLIFILNSLSIKILVTQMDN